MIINSKGILFSLLVLFISFLMMNFTMQTSKQYPVNVLVGKGGIKLYGTNFKLQKEAYSALNMLIDDAKKQGLHIKVVSAYRSFDHQKRIWNRKYIKFINQGLSPIDAVNKVKEYTAIPGTSRHHWGTDVDLSVNSKLSNSKNKFIKWMNLNAHKYGFYRVYTKNKLREGYKYESWHYSYRKLANPMLKQYNKLNLVNLLKNTKILGSEYFTTSFINNYKERNVLGINDYLY